MSPLSMETMEGPPTYGTCRMCYSSGPIGMDCICCEKPGTQYLMLMTVNGIKDIITIDAEWFAGVVGGDHKIAKADRMHQWVCPPFMLFEPTLLHTSLVIHAKKQRLSNALIENRLCKYFDGIHNYTKEERTEIFRVGSTETKEFLWA